MKKLLHFFTFAFCLSLFSQVYCQQKGLSTHFTESLINQNVQLSDQLITGDIKALRTETSKLKSTSEDWLQTDRTYSYLWNAAESYWETTSVYFYYYDANYNKDEKLEKSPDGSAPKQKTLYYYDDNNELLLEERIFDYNSSDWVLRKKILYTYDFANDKLLENLTQNWDGSKFKDYNKTTYVYNDNNKLSYYISQYWISDNWINSARWTYSYDQNNLLYKMDNETWDSDESEWLKFSRNFLTRDEENGNLLLMISEYWNDDNNTWEARLRQNYYYNDEGYMYSMLSERWKDADNYWQNVFSQAYTYLPAGSEQIMALNSDINKSIDDFQTTEDELIINLEKRAGINNSLFGVELLIDSVMHTSDGDLEFTLSHNDITESIIYKTGGNGDNFINTTLSDRAIDSVSKGRAPFLGMYKAENPLSSFLATDPEGTWKLSIYDGVAGNTGILKSWGINLIYASNSAVTPNEDATLSSIQINDEELPGFSSNSLEYSIEQSTSTIPIPTVSATSTDENATVVITQTSQLPGTATILITAEDGVTQKIYTVEFSIPTSTLGFDLSNEILLYPNPTKEKLKVQSAEFRSQSSDFEIYDLAGKKQIEKYITTGTETVEIDVSSLQNGIYFCRIILDNQSVTKKLIIQK